LSEWRRNGVGAVLPAATIIAEDTSIDYLERVLRVVIDHYNVHRPTGRRRRDRRGRVIHEYAVAA
jgi:hypothetical protein